MRLSSALVGLALLFALAHLGGAAAAEKKPNPYLLPDGKILGQSGRYYEINGVSLYCETHGSGPPFMLIHGDFGMIEMWVDLVPVLMKHFTVILPERRGHGRSNDKPGVAFTYDLFAEDMAALMKAMGIKRAHVVGHSGGANTALLMALRHPDLVDRIVGLSTWFSAVGSTPQAFSELSAISPDNLPPEMAAFWKKVNPMGQGYFPTFIEKMRLLQFTSPTLVPADLKKIAAPMLIVMGDRDWMTYDHTLTLFNALPRRADPGKDAKERQLAVVPGSGHMYPYDKPGLTAKLILDFLTGKEGESRFGELIQKGID